MVATTAFMASVISSSPNTDLFLFLLGSTNVLLGTPKPPTVALASIVGKGGWHCRYQLGWCQSLGCQCSQGNVVQDAIKSANGMAEGKYLMHLGVVVNMLVHVLASLGCS
jgi:hypothetical protein